MSQMASLTVCSNRGPVRLEYEGARIASKGGGPNGLIPVVLPALRAHGGRWVYSAASEGERTVAHDHPDGYVDREFAASVALVPVAVSTELQARHYETVSIGCLSFVFHQLFHLPTAPRFGADFFDAWDGYRAVNAQFAKTVSRVDAEPVLVEDYHLLLLPDELRRLEGGRRRNILYFHHVSWCSPEYFAVLPGDIRGRILRSLLQCDSIGFHSRRWADAFLACCSRFLRDVRPGPTGVAHGAGFTEVVVAPAAIDAAALLARAESSETLAAAARFKVLARDRWTLVRVDRADLWKNAIGGFLAFEHLLASRPDLVSRLWFLAILTPVRSWHPDYVDYMARCREVVRRINSDHGVAGDDPVTLITIEGNDPKNRETSLGALSVADGVLVNSIVDGLNVVAFETSLVSRSHPVLILSENCGAHEVLGEYSLNINPYDVEETAAAIEHAYGMSRSERRDRSAASRAFVTSRSPAEWVARRLGQL